MRLRSAASIAAALALVIGLSGCSVFAFPHTQDAYDPSDGVGVTVGDISLLNVIVFSEDGEDGNFTGGAVNRSDDDIQLVLQYESGGEKVDVEIEIPARETVILGEGEDGQVFLPGIDSIPGSLMKIYVQYGDRPGKQIDVPVLNTDLPEYTGLLPTPTPTPTPTVEATPEPEPTP